MFHHLLTEAIEEICNADNNIRALCEEFSLLVQQKHGLTDEEVDTVTSALLDYVKQYGGNPDALIPSDITRAVRMMLQRLGKKNEQIYAILKDPLVIKNFAKNMRDELAAAKEPEPVATPKPKMVNPFPAPGQESIEQRLAAVFS